VKENKKGQPREAGLAVEWQMVEHLLPRFVQGPQAARTQAHSLGFAVPDDRHLLDVRLPLALGPDHRVANIVPKRRRFAADITLGHNFTSHLDREPQLQLAF
jgi:hypothetical protein